MNRQATSEHKGRGGQHVAKRHGDGRPNSRRTTVAPEIRRAMIAEAAYYRAERRGFAPGDDLDDWLQAEAEIESLLKQGMQ